MQEIIVYTDGSCIGNPGPGGWAALIMTDDLEKEISGHDKDTTNNRMEMTAIIEALKFIRKNHGTEAKIIINSDSNLIIQTLKQGWKRKANTDLWAELDKARAWLNISWNWVKAHHTNPHNNRVDELAQKQARKA